MRIARNIRCDRNAVEVRSLDPTTAIVVTGAFLLILGSIWLLRRWRRRGFHSAVDQATWSTLHSASLASRHLADGLTEASAERAGRHVLGLLGARALAISCVEQPHLNAHYPIVERRRRPAPRGSP